MDHVPRGSAPETAAPDTMPDGAPLKVLDVARMKRVLDGWTPPTALRAGLEKTIAWYRANKAEADAKW